MDEKEKVFSVEEIAKIEKQVAKEFPEALTELSDGRGDE